jgi:sugar phosphate isomerase/epimerase
VREFCGIIDFASEFGCTVNIGRARGFIEPDDTLEETEKRFAESINTVARHAAKNNITLVLEPVNRYETNYINSVAEGAALVRKLGISNLMLMPDVFHMNIEDASIEQILINNGELIDYVHFADSNRLAPGWGHLDFASFINALKKAGYYKKNNWITAEILPKPSSDEAAKQAIDYLRGVI